MLRVTRRYGVPTALLLVAAACGHTDAFTPPDTGGSTQPLVGGEPARLTYNEGQDLAPAWLPDGSALVYAFDQAHPSLHDFDRCLGVLPAAGGTRTAELCDLPAIENDSMVLLSEPAPAADGRIAYLRSTHHANRVGGSVEVEVGRLVRGGVSLRVAFPYPRPAGTPRNGLSHFRWLDDSRAVFVGGLWTSYMPCDRCTAIPYFAGREIVLLQIGPSGGTYTTFAGTDSASSVTPGENADVVYFTRQLDTRVYRLQVSSGAVSVAFDFGSAGVARDVQVHGSQMYAVVGGKVTRSDNFDAGTTQFDEGGPLMVVDLTTGAMRTLGDNSHFFRCPALSPDGTTLVAQGYAVRFVSIDPTTVDTIVTRGADLWRFGQP